MASVSLPTEPDEIPEYASDLNITWTEDRTGDYSIPINVNQFTGADQINTNTLFDEMEREPRDAYDNPLRFGRSLLSLWSHHIRSTAELWYGEMDHDTQEFERDMQEMRNTIARISIFTGQNDGDELDDLLDDTRPRNQRQRIWRPNGGVLPNSNNCRSTHGKFACVTSVELVNNNDDECNTFECGVCLEDKPESNKAIYGCGHTFCNDCNCQYLMARLRERKKPKCHVCREYIRSIKLMTNEEKANVDEFVV